MALNSQYLDSKTFTQEIQTQRLDVIGKAIEEIRGTIFEATEIAGRSADRLFGPEVEAESMASAVSAPHEGGVVAQIERDLRSLHSDAYRLLQTCERLSRI